MRLLILGGTAFLGRHLVELAQQRNYEITLFNRGQRNPGLYPEVEHLRGDRGGDLEALKGRRWDAVVDTSGYIPRAVRATAELLCDAVEHYTFISTISVYASFATSVSEDSALGTLEDPGVEEVTGESYGPLKVLCEQAAETSMVGRVLTIRPGIIVGPYDPTDRFTYWVRRVARGGEVLAPGRPDGRVEYIDVRDLAGWTLDLVEQRKTGTYNASGPGYPLTMGQLLEACKAVSKSDARFTWASEEFLLAAGVQPWSELPLWIAPDSNPDYAAFAQVNVERARLAGLTFRPLAETIGATLAWDATRPADLELRAGLKPEREVDLLQAWHTRQ